MSREEREKIVQDACADFRKVLVALFVDGSGAWRRHALGLMSSIGKLIGDRGN